MKNFNILGVHVKLRILRWGGGGHVKPIYRGGITLMGVTWTACRFQISDLMGGGGGGGGGGWGGGGVTFEGRLTPQCTLRSP